MMALGIWNMGEARAAAGEAWVGQPGRRSRLVGLTEGEERGAPLGWDAQLVLPRVSSGTGFRLLAPFLHVN